MDRHVALARAHLREGYHALRHERVSTVGLILLLVGAWRSTLALHNRAAMVSDAALWLLVGGILLGIAGLAALDAAQAGLRDDEVALLLPLPLLPATRFRLLVQAIFQRQVALLLALSSAVLLAGLGTQALPWAGVLLGGGLLATVLAPLVMLLLVRDGARSLPTLIGGALVVAAFGGGVAALSASPVGVALLALAGVALLLGPFAGRLGQVQVGAMLVLQQASRSQAVRRLPGVAWLVGRLSRQRSLAAALLVRDLLARHRNPLMWARLAVLPIYLTLAVAARDRLFPADLPPLLPIVATSGALLLLLLFDSAPSPIGGEGERLALLLTTPLSDRSLLRAYWWALFWPALIVLLAMALPITLLVALPFATWPTLGAALALLAATMTTVLAWGSVWDADLSAQAGGAMQSFLLEEAPTTVARLFLAGVSVAVLASHLALLYILAAPVALAMFGVASLVGALLLERLAARRLVGLRR